MGVRIKLFGHAGDGNLHVYILRDDLSKDDWKKVLEATMERMYDHARDLDGQVSGEHGIGISKRHYFLRETPRANLEVMNRVKDALDPLHILNDKKSYILGGTDQ